nr:hypothetical protein BaRGS_024219 [Batillaria attramentaria]
MYVCALALFVYNTQFAEQVRQTGDGEFHHVANLNGWVDVEAVAMSQWPEVTDKELYNYLVYTCNRTVFVFYFNLM